MFEIVSAVVSKAEIGKNIRQFLKDTELTKEENESLNEERNIIKQNILDTFKARIHIILSFFFFFFFFLMINIV